MENVKKSFNAKQKLEISIIASKAELQNSKI